MRTYLRIYLFITTVIIFSGHSFSQIDASDESIERYVPVFDNGDLYWVDSVFNSLTLEERIAQLFMVAAWSNKGQDHEKEIGELILKHHVGGLIFFQGGPARQVELTRKYQTISNVPLLIGMDLEWGLAMRIDSTIRYPRQMALGAIRDNDMIYQMGADIADQMKQIGVHVNFAPVVDVNNNAANPVINSRSFGEDKENVSLKGAAYMKGMQDHGILANAKHFPGHGDTDTDSHYALPLIPFDRARLDTMELVPFKALIGQGLGSMMVAHLSIPQLDSTPNLPSTLSPAVVDQLLKKELGFEGLIFTDAMNMRGLAAHFKPGEADVLALKAGNDVLLFPGDVPKAIGMIKQAIESGDMPRSIVDDACYKVLKAKYWCGLSDSLRISRKGLHDKLNEPIYSELRNELAESALTVLRNENDLIPLTDLNNKKIAVVSFGAKNKNDFHSTLEWYADVDLFSLPRSPSSTEANSLKALLKEYDHVIFSVHGFSTPKNNFGVSQNVIKAVQQVNKEKPTIVVLFANPYSLAKFYGAEKLEVLVAAFEDRPEFHKAAAQLIFGGTQATGRLPITASGSFKYGDGVDTKPAMRMAQAAPESVGISSVLLEQIDSIALDGIDKKAYPGCVVLVAKKGKVIYHKGFGHHSYKYRPLVDKDDVYDLASITKIASTTAALMKLVGEGKIDLNFNLCDYLPEMVDTSEKYMNMNLRDMLSHQAQLVPWIPFYQKTIKQGAPDPALYSRVKDDKYDTRVAEDLYILESYRDTMMKRILETKLRRKKEYKYSDLGYYFMQSIIEKVTGMSLDEYVMKNFYEPLDLRTMGYHPRERIDMDDIVPTEYDVAFRRQQIHGDVHDPGTAMMGGVGGHAGVFSNAIDLAVFMQMLLNGGTYGGDELLKKEVIDEFTRCQFCTGRKDENRRAAGFDKPVQHGGPGPTCDCVSYASFGHSGFTGTLAWADPEEDLVYVFLSNRIYPNAQNKKLISMGIRTEIMQVIYDAIGTSEQKRITIESPELGPAGQ